MNLAQLLVSLLVICSQVEVISAIIKRETPATCATGSEVAAYANTFFDSVRMKCVPCKGTNTVPAKDYLSCVCAAGAIRVPDPAVDAAARPPTSYFSNFHPTCKACSELLAGSAPNKAQTQCMSCAPGAGVSLVGSQCQCSASTAGYLIETANGAPTDPTFTTVVGSYSCGACAAGYSDADNFKGPIDVPIYKCEKCAAVGMRYETRSNKAGENYECICKTGYTLAGDICVPAQYIDQSGEEWSTTIQFENVAGDDGEAGGQMSKTSDTLEELQLKSAYLCTTTRDQQQCMVMANMCVLQLYSLQTSVCQAYLAMVTAETEQANPEFYPDGGFKKGLPWLYYVGDDGEPRPGSEVIQNSGRVKFRTSFSIENRDLGIVSKLQFKLAEYDVYGNFLQFEDLSDQLFICETPAEDVDMLLEIGNTLLQSCAFDLSRLTAQSTFPKVANKFYDMFLVDSDGSLVDVPIKVNQLYNSQGEQANLQDDASAWVLTRRFFIFDTVSGLEGAGALKRLANLNDNGERNEEITVVRYARNMTLKVELDMDPNFAEAIYVPYLEIEYEEKAADKLDDDEAKYKDVYFISEYTMGQEGFVKLRRAIFFVLLVSMLLIWLALTYSRMNASTGAGTATLIVKSVMSLFEVFSTFYFWYLYAMTGAYFIFFKYQQRVYVLLPGLDIQYNFEPYDGMLGVVALTKLLSLTNKIYFDQSQQNIFFLDWEAEKTLQAGRRGYAEGVNPWRRLYIANEFNELQGTKHVTTELILLLFLVVVEGFGYKYLALMQSSTERAPTDSPESFPLSFFVITTVIFGLGTGEYFLQMLLQLRNPPSYVDFVDLCSVANISVMLFNDSFQGHYIHGKSPLGAADVSSERLRLNLEAEGQGEGAARGIHPSRAQDQTFEIFLPAELINRYHKAYYTPVADAIAGARNAAHSGSPMEAAFHLGPAIPEKMPLSVLEQKQRQMNKIMKKYIERASSDPAAYVRDHRARPVWEKLLGARPGEGGWANPAFPVMIPDPGLPSYAKSLLFGLDFDFMILECLVIACMDRCNYLPNGIQSGMAFGVLMAYLFDSALIWLRVYVGRRNLARHTLSDERFMIG